MGDGNTIKSASAVFGTPRSAAGSSLAEQLQQLKEGIRNGSVEVRQLSGGREEAEQVLAEIRGAIGKRRLDDGDHPALDAYRELADG
jgi:hypothetical protein